MERGDSYRTHAWRSMWSASHSGQLSVIMMVMERALGSWLHRPCRVIERGEANTTDSILPAR